MAGRQAAQNISRYAGLQVQTSSLGLQIPVGWGTFRCKCNLVDYLDFKATAQKASTGKGGGGQTTGYSYSASVVLAILDAQIDAVSQVWVNSKNYAAGSVGSNVVNTGSTSALAQAGLSLATGAIGQAVWPYLTTNHPDHAIGYSGLAYAYAPNYALDSSASPPNHSFEVVRTTGFVVGGGYAGPDVDPSAVVSDFFTNSRTGVPSWGAGLLDATSLAQYQAYTLAAGLLVSPVIDQARSAADFLTELFLATNSTCVWSEGLLKFVPYGDTALTGNGKTYTPNLTPIYALDDDDFIVKSKGDPPLLIDIEDQSDAYNAVQLEYLDRTNQYNMAIAFASDAANVAQFKQRRQDPTTVHCICTPSVAAIAAHLYLQRTLYIRAQYRFTLSWAFALLEPGDIVELTDPGLGLSAYPVRIVEIDENEANGDADGTLDLVCEDLLVGVSNTPLYTMQNSAGAQPNTGIDPGGVEANLLLQSQDFTNATWTKTNLTVTAAATTNPISGASDAQKLIPTVTNGGHSATESTIAIFSGANYTASVYFKAAGYNFGRLRVTNGGATNLFEVIADLAGGTIVTQSVTGSMVLVGAPVLQSLGSGWYRLGVTFQTPDTSVNFSVRPAATNTTAGFAGNATDGVYAWGTQLTQGVALRPYTLTTTATSGPLIFNPPMALTPGGLQTWAAVAGGPNFGGCNVWVSYDGTNYQLVGQTQQGAARLGQLTASLASHADPDTADTLSVDLSASNGSLVNASQTTTDAGGTLCLVGSELIGFRDVTLTAANRYNLVNYLRRGMLSTPIAAHSVGDNFIRLDSAIFAFPYNAQQVGRSATVKFQPFNIWGQGVTPLSNCIAYSVVPSPATLGSPTSTAWTATFTTQSSGGVTQPVIVITGSSDNLSASGIEFFYRPTGTASWVSTGICGPTTQQKIITGILQSQTYDVGVAYLVNGVLTPIQPITGTGGTSGGSGSGIGTAVCNDSRPGAHNFPIPSGATYTHVDIVITGYAGQGNGTGSGKGGFVDRGGGGGNVVIVLGFPVTPGTTVIAYNLGSSSGASSTATYSTTLSLTAKGGTDATTSTAGTGGPNTGTQTATGATSVNSYAGRNGGLTNTWDGGGPGKTVTYDATATTPSAGAGPDLTTDFTAGTIPGQGAAGMSGNQLAGGGANILIIART